VRTLRRREADARASFGTRGGAKAAPRRRGTRAFARGNLISRLTRNRFGDGDGGSPGPIKATTKRWLGFDNSFTPSPPPAAQAPQSVASRPSASTASSRCSSLSIVCIPVDGLNLLHLHPLVDGEVPPSPAAVAAHRQQGLHRRRAPAADE
jgi:hypothetical protein